MTQTILINQYNNPLEKELINLFHKSNLPKHFNHKGNKHFNNLQRMSLIILFRRTKKSIRDFLIELKESKWTSWLDLPRIPKRSTFHDWLKLFCMKCIRKLLNLLRPKKAKLTAIDGTGFDSWQRSRHYEKRVGEVQAPPMPYAKADLFIDVPSRKVIDFSLVMHHQHDIVAAKAFVNRNVLKGIVILADKGYDSERLHESIRNKGGTLFAPVRKSGRKRPKGRYRQRCVTLPNFMGQRSIVEAVNASIKRKQIECLRSKKNHMKKKEFAWHMIVYNIRRNIELSIDGEFQEEVTFYFLIILI